MGPAIVKGEGAFFYQMPNRRAGVTSKKREGRMGPGEFGGGKTGALASSRLQTCL